MTDFSFADEFASFGDDLKGVAYEGDHQMRVRKAEAGATAKGKQKFTLTLEFAGGPNKGKTIVDNLVWSPESEIAAKIFAQNLRVLGAPQEWIMQTKPSPEDIAEQITGTVFDARLKPDEFNGQPQTRVSYRKTISLGNPVAGVKSAAASAAVSLDDEAPAAVQEPVGAVAGGGSDNPWA
jgi:hypothetical protein